jgi:hypothetical protein
MRWGVFFGGIDDGSDYGSDDITGDHRTIFTQETDLWLTNTCTLRAACRPFWWSGRIVEWHILRGIC